MSAALAAALDYASRGWRVLPLATSAKVPLRGGHGFLDASAEEGVIRGWFTGRPQANVGIACQPSGLLVIDWDPRHDPDALHEVEAERGPLPPTPRVLTGGGGAHLLFAHPGLPVVGQVRPGLDVKSSGYVVAPPSRHPNGNAYAWEVEPGEVPLALLPARWLERVTVPGEQPVHRPHGLRTEAADDWLFTIPPRRYALAICGAHADGRGWITCPSPPSERSPSLQLFDTPERGWRCFRLGCQRPDGRCAGGTVVDFMAHAIGYTGPLRGSVYLYVREVAERLVLEHAGVDV